MTRFPLLIMAIALCVLPACADHQAVPSDVLKDRATEIDKLLSAAEQGTAEDKTILACDTKEGW